MTRNASTRNSGKPRKASALPPYLRGDRTEPQEIEDLPLQVSLLTMEIAAIRERLDRLGIMALPIEGADNGD